MNSENKRKGTVKFYIDEKLYGFITDDETGEDVHVPVAGLIDEIRKNDRVSFVIQEGRTGKEAIDVRVVKK